MNRPGKVATLYAVVALTWILFSDQAVRFAGDGAGDFITEWQSVKGILFVVVTAAVLYFAVRHYFRQIEAAQREKQEVFESTVDTAAQILNNFLNDMIYFRMVAEDTPFIDRAVLHEYDEVINKTGEKLHRLSSLENVSPGEIRSWLRQEEGHYYCPLPGDRPDA